MTVDVDCKLDPEASGVFDVLPRLENELDINVELVAPDAFTPELLEWRERSQFIANYGRINFYHYDFYSQALAKIERYHARYKNDVRKMIERGLIQPDKLFVLFKEIEPNLKRFSTIEPNPSRIASKP